MNPQAFLRSRIAAGAGQEHDYALVQELMAEFDLDQNAAVGLVGQALYPRCPTPSDHSEADAMDETPTGPRSDELFDAEDERLLEHERRRLRVRQRLAREARGSTTFPSLLTLRERLARTPEGPVPMRIANLQPRGGNLLISAQNKTGKTTLVENYIRSLVDGQPFLDQFAVLPVEGTVTLVDVEMSPAQHEAWFRRQDIRRDDKVVLISLKGQVSAFDVLDLSTRRQWAGLLRDRGTEVLIVDCLRPVLDVLGLDERAEAGKFLVGLDSLGLEAGIREIVLVQHMGHAGERSRGDSRIGDWPACEWQLVRRGEHPAAPRYLRAFGRDVNLPETLVAFDEATRHLSLRGSRDDATGGAALPAVLAVLDGAPGVRMSGRAIKDAIRGTADAPSRDAIDAALRFGVRTLVLNEVAGPRGAKLYARVQCPEEIA